MVDLGVLVQLSKDTFDTIQLSMSTSIYAFCVVLVIDSELQLVQGTCHDYQVLPIIMGVPIRSVKPER